MMGRLATTGISGWSTWYGDIIPHKDKCLSLDENSKLVYILRMPSGKFQTQVFVKGQYYITLQHEQKPDKTYAYRVTAEPITKKT